jgi:hypothetical protein
MEGWQALFEVGRVCLQRNAARQPSRTLLNGPLSPFSIVLYLPYQLPQNIVAIYEEIQFAQEGQIALSPIDQNVAKYQWP